WLNLFRCIANVPSMHVRTVGGSDDRFAPESSLHTPRQGTAVTAPPESERSARPSAASPIRAMSLWPPPRSARHNNRRPKLPLILGVGVGVVVLAVMVGSLLWGEEEPEPEEPPAVVTDGIPEEYAGSWSGEMSQHDEEGNLVADWVVQLKLDAGTDRGSAELLPFHCRGSIVLTEQTAESLVFDYAQIYGSEDCCIKACTLSLGHRARVTIEATWEGISHGGHVRTSTGIRKEVRPMPSASQDNDGGPIPSGGPMADPPPLIDTD